MIREAPAAVRINPFPGLRPFEAKEDYLFFGRETQVDEMLRRLRSTRFLTVLGASGCGKSSLVRSGLIPSLYGGAMTRAGASWRVAILRPGHDPLGNLAVALASPEALGGGRNAELTQAFFETTLRASKLGLVECVLQAHLPPGDNVLVLVDQFEELFRFKQSGKETRHEEAAAFVRLLIEAARHREVPIYLVLTMRSDFFDRCMGFPDLPEAINDGLYLVPRMSRDELRAAITGPVAVGGGEISPPLVARLLNDVGDNPDQLPILQHALLRTWDRWEQEGASGEIELDHYNAIGTMDRALSQHAEEALGELDDEGRRIAEILFKALTEKGADGRGVRRPATLQEICDLTGADERAVTAVVDRFRQPGRSFIILRSDAYLDLSHESLMRIWETLRDWVDEEAQSAQIYLGAARAAARHEQGTAALWRDPELQTALSWRETAKPTAVWAQRYDPGFEPAMRFLDASAEERRKEIAEREERRRGEQRQKLWRRVVWLLSVAALVTLGFGIYAYAQKNYATIALLRAEHEKQKAGQAKFAATEAAQRAEQQQLIAQADRRLAEDAEVRAIQLKRTAEEKRQEAEDQKRIAEQQKKVAEIQQRRAETNADAAKTERDAARRAGELAERESAKAKESEAQARRLRQLALARAVALQTLRLPADQEKLPALLALAAYRLHLKNGGNPEEADHFNALRAALDQLRPQPAWTDHLDAVRAVAVDPQGGSLYSGSEDGRLRRFDLRPRGPRGTVLATFRKGIRAIAVDPKGDRLAAGSVDGSLKVLDLRTSTAPERELTGSGAPVVALAFQQGEGLLAVGRANGEVSLWAPGAPSGSPLLSPAGKSLTSLAFSQDGTLLAAGFAQGGALLWNLQKISRPPTAFCLEADVRSVAFQPHDVYLACGTASGDIVLETLAYRHATPKYRRLLRGHRSSVNALAFRADLSLASGSADHTVRLWDLTRSDTEPEAVGRDDKDPEDFDTEPIVLTGHPSWVWSVAFLPDGDHLVSGGADRTVRLWEARTKKLADELCRLVPHQLTDDQWTKFFGDESFEDNGEVCPK